MRASAILILVVVLLVLFGLVMLVSTSGPQGEKLFGNPYYFTQRQVAWLLVGMVAAWIGAKVDYHRWMKLAWPLLGATLILLALVYMPGIGLNIKGSHRWLRLPFGLSFQPSELAKFVAINALAFWFGTKQRERGGFMGGIAIPGAILGSMLGLIVFETDFGATVLIGATGGLMMFVAGAPFLYLLPAGVLAVGGLAWMIKQNPERMGRIMAFLHPEQYAQGEAFQLMNALYAFVAGGAAGVGLGQSLQKQHYLPEAHTDFIFAIIGEELGIGASVGVVLLFALFMLCGLRISGRAADAGGRLMAFGITILITLQAAINIGVVTGRLPTKGLPLPFISFGGTSLMVTLFMTGVLLNIARQGSGGPRLRRT
ncbi:MAG TPA: putative lipid II flippase FtsW [Verrucomicrobia bacterium]|nr:putative lipid II flippase FtsW [Verrucomicrobiota bacterium]